ncbi:hypothetical protein EVAR_37912_1 [Eumeta japonica]|uniref:Uncharacterized protein n=1 Tax=Eumeta variegata TaxID=151549 RepID=A0A4C1XEH1_EUMVA|nr:hypothetical protein EVAR_37912_1 [Eumeta japonica]
MNEVICRPVDNFWLKPWTLREHASAKKRYSQGKEILSPGASPRGELSLNPILSRGVWVIKFAELADKITDCRVRHLCEELSPFCGFVISDASLLNRPWTSTYEDVGFIRRICIGNLSS